MISILHRSERQFINVSEYSSVSHCYETNIHIPKWFLWDMANGRFL